MKMAYGKLALVVNKLRSNKLPDRMKEISEKTKADIVIGLPDDDEVSEFAQENKNFLQISDSNAVYKKVMELVI